MTTWHQHPSRPSPAAEDDFHPLPLVGITSQPRRLYGRLIATIAAGGIAVVLLIGFLYYATNPFGDSLAMRQHSAGSISAHADLAPPDTFATTTGETVQSSMIRINAAASVSHGALAHPPRPIVQEIRNGASTAAANASLPAQVIRDGASVASANASLPGNGDWPTTAPMADVLPGDGTGGVQLVNGFGPPSGDRAADAHQE